MVSSSDSTEISALRVKTSPPTESSAVLSLASAATPMEPKARSATLHSRREWRFIVVLRSRDQQAKFRQQSKILLHGLARHTAARAIGSRHEGRIQIANQLID